MSDAQVSRPFFPSFREGTGIWPEITNLPLIPQEVQGNDETPLAGCTSHPGKESREEVAGALIPTPSQSAHPAAPVSLRLCGFRGTVSTQSSVRRAGPWTPWGLGEPHCTCPCPASSLVVGRVRWPDLCCLSFGSHFQGFSPKIRLSLGEDLPTSKQPLWKGSQGEQAALPVLFPLISPQLASLRLLR